MFSNSGNTGSSKSSKDKEKQLKASQEKMESGDLKQQVSGFQEITRLQLQVDPETRCLVEKLKAAEDRMNSTTATQQEKDAARTEFDKNARVVGQRHYRVDAYGSIHPGPAHSLFFTGMMGIPYTNWGKGGDERTPKDTKQCLL
ncbi:MAG: hypothetical protein Q9162_001829 [Coniocarpon cinnabarinum]